jgi:hypothetical protein
LDNEDLGRAFLTAAAGTLERLGVAAWVICWEEGRGLVLLPLELEPQLSQQPQQPLKLEKQLPMVDEWGEGGMQVRWRGGGRARKKERE